jgi:hypothetical protein
MLRLAAFLTALMMDAVSTSEVDKILKIIVFEKFTPYNM